LFTSIEGWGSQAEYMRTGLQCSHWERNFLEAIDRGFKVNIMCTFNILCVATFQNFLEKVIEWRKKYGKQALSFDTPYLKEPPHWMINILPQDFLNEHMDRHLQFIKDNMEWFTDVEYEKMLRVRDYAHQNPVDANKIKQGRRDFYSFFNETDKRVVGLKLLEVFPMYEDFYNQCKEVYDNYE